ncbi:hypothetical protein DFJ73DRAFT_92757 [Zopfochytrium polystomum]|nr:hypothetical protein DFJ73DRAFT_92757 [Zopfochytrium polystomum]
MPWETVTKHWTCGGSQGLGFVTVFDVFRSLCSTQVPSSLTRTIFRAGFKALQSQHHSITEDDLSFLTRGTRAIFQPVRKYRWADLLIAGSSSISAEIWNLNAKSIIQNASEWKLTIIGELNLLVFTIKEGLLSMCTAVTMVNAAIKLLKAIPDSGEFDQSSGIITSACSIFTAACSFGIKVKSKSMENDSLYLQVAPQKAMTAILDCKALQEYANLRVREAIRMLTEVVPPSEVFQE